MDPANEEPSYWLESSYYGPGALLCWYLTLASIIINWIWHPTARFAKLKVSSDIIAFLTYPCLAAGHLVRQIALFEPSNRPLINFWFFESDLAYLARHDEVTNNDPIAPSVRNTISAINAPFRICIVAITITSVTLLVIGFSSTTSRPRRTKPLPWALLLAHLCILTCLGCIPIIWRRPNLYSEFIACAMSILIGLPVLMFTFFSVCMGSFGAFMLITNLQVYLNLKRPNSRLMGEKYHDALAETSLLAAGVAMLFQLFIVIWTGLRRIIPTSFWPDVGVEMAALDQIFALAMGISTFLLTVHEVFLKGARRRLRIKKAWVWVVEAVYAWERVAGNW